MNFHYAFTTESTICFKAFIEGGTPTKATLSFISIVGTPDILCDTALWYPCGVDTDVSIAITSGSEFATSLTILTADGQYEHEGEVNTSTYMGFIYTISTY